MLCSTPVSCSQADNILIPNPVFPYNIYIGPYSGNKIIYCKIIFFCDSGCNFTTIILQYPMYRQLGNRNECTCAVLKRLLLYHVPSTAYTAQGAGAVKKIKAQNVQIILKQFSTGVRESSFMSENNKMRSILEIMNDVLSTVRDYYESE